ncbi:MAG: glycosyltransferase family 39 protein [Bacteroidota bacterium]
MNHILKKSLLLILLLTISVRLYHITFPIAGWHSWRQSDTAAIARNFFTEENNILYPRIDWRGSTPGYVETEFQIYTFTVATAYTLFGENEVFGRLFSVFCAAGTVFGIYLLVKKIIDETVAKWSAFFYAVLPLNIYYGRAFMPEQLMLMCSVWGVLLFDRWIDAPSNLKLFFGSLCAITLATLIKLPALYLGLPLLFLCWNKYGSGFVRQPTIWMYAAGVLLPTGAWYYHAHQLKAATGLTFGIWEMGTDKWGNTELLTTVKFYNDVFFKNIAERHFTYAAFIPFIVGLFITHTHTHTHTHKERLFDFWLIAVVIYILIVARGNQVHEYYQLPLMIPGVVFLGKSFAAFVPKESPLNRRKKILRYAFLFLLAGTLMLSFLRVEKVFNGEQIESTMFQLAESVKAKTPNESLIITVSEGNPVLLYNCCRKGWTCSPGTLNEDYLNERRSDNAKYIVAEKEVFVRNHQEQLMQKLLMSNTVVDDTDGYFIIAL